MIRLCQKADEIQPMHTHRHALQVFARLVERGDQS